MEESHVPLQGQDASFAYIWDFPLTIPAKYFKTYIDVLNLLGIDP